MKTAISVPDTDFERFERVAARHGMSRSEFYRRAAASLADELEGASRLTQIADQVLRAAGQPDTDGLMVAENRRHLLERSEW